MSEFEKWWSTPCKYCCVLAVSTSLSFQSALHRMQSHSSRWLLHSMYDGQPHKWFPKLEKMKSTQASCEVCCTKMSLRTSSLFRSICKAWWLPGSFQLMHISCTSPAHLALLALQDKRKSLPPLKSLPNRPLSRAVWWRFPSMLILSKYY